MNRSTIRKHVFLMLFRVEFHEEAELELQDKLYFDDFENVEISESAKQVIQNKVSLIKENMEAIDKRIAEISEGWTIDRLGKIELTILRLAVGEILFDDQVPLSVAINEAVELAKKFGGDSSPAFVNGLLAKMA